MMYDFFTIQYACVLDLDLDFLIYNIGRNESLTNSLTLVGFHVDDSEVTLNVCLSRQFSGGELFFRGMRCDKHLHTGSHSEVSNVDGIT